MNLSQNHFKSALIAVLLFSLFVPYLSIIYIRNCPQLLFCGVF